MELYLEDPDTDLTIGEDADFFEFYPHGKRAGDVAAQLRLIVEHFEKHPDAMVIVW